MEFAKFNLIPALKYVKDYPRLVKVEKNDFY